MKEQPKSLKTNHLGGGGLPPADVIKVRIKEFTRKKRHCEVTELRPPWRNATAFLLSDWAGWSNKEIAEFLKIDQRTVKSDINLADMLRRWASNLQPYIDSLKEYILWYSKYLK